MTRLESISSIETQVRLGALRWLHHLDLNEASPTYGVADREYWSWKTKDFPNGTWQGGLAGFLDSSRLLSFDSLQLRKIVSATLRGTSFIQRGNGSFEEAYPFESSYAVTALVLFNLLYSHFRYSELFDQEANAHLLEIVQKATVFLEKTPETHGVISNHLATGDLALLLSRKYLNVEASTPAYLSLQKKEGWFPEYGGCDPGYQTLLNHYQVACDTALSFNSSLLESLEKSIKFLERFAFPDGSFAGELGSRGTSIVYPGGLWNIGNRGTPLSHWFLTHHCSYLGAVTPTNVDAGNFVPVFNSWALYLKIWEVASPSPSHLNFFPQSFTSWCLPEAQLFGASTQSSQLVLSFKNGAIRKCSKEGERIKDESLVAFPVAPSTFLVPFENEIKEKFVKILFKEVKQTSLLNNALRSTALRLLSVLVYLFPFAQRLLKNILAHFVMNRKNALRGETIELTLDLTHNDLPITINAKQCLPYGFNQHMASANTFDPRAL